MNAPLSLAPLLDALREAGLTVGFAEQARLRQVFGLAPGATDEARLRSLLRAVLVKSAEQHASFDRVFDAWLEEAEHELRRRRPTRLAPLALSTAPLEPAAAAKRPIGTSTSARWLSVAVVCAAVAVAIWLIFNPAKQVDTPPQPVKPPPLPPELVETPKDSFKTVRPLLTITPAKPRWHGWPEAILGALALLATAFAYWRLHRRRWLPEPEPAPTRQGPPRVWVEAADAGPLLLAPDEQQGLIWGIGHFVSEAPTRRLDLAATVRATAGAGGILSVRFLAARHQREVWLWLDESAQDPALRRLADEIAELLPAYGLAVERASFWGVPETLATPSGQRFAPKEIEERSAAALVAVLTDGRLLLRQYEADDHRARTDALLRTLSHWPQLWFVDPDAGANGLAAALGRFAIACIHPRELPGRLSGDQARSQPAAAATSDERLWSAACALAPSPVSDGLAWALLRHLELSATPWALARLRRHAQGPAQRLQWRRQDRAERVNWLVACEVQQAEHGQHTVLARALEFWERTLAEDYERRRQAAAEGWQDMPAERHLRMERQLLALWRRPGAAIPGLYALFQGALIEPIRAQLAALAPQERGGREHIRLPWSWQERSGPEQQMLLEMGFCSGALKAVRLRKPGRYWLGLALGAGLAAGALMVSATRPWVAPAVETPPVLSHRGTPPPTAKATVLPLQDGRWPVRISTPKWLVEDAAPPAAQVEVSWSEEVAPCRDEIDGAELWRCGARPGVARGQLELHRRLVVLATAPARARALAMRLLDSGNADQLLIDPDWPRQRARLLGSTRSELPRDEQLLVLREARAESPPAAEPIAGAIELAVAPDSWKSLANALDFSGTRAAAEVWPDARVLAGNLDAVAFAGLSRCPREAVDARSGLKFVELCGGTFTMGSPPGEASRDSDEAQHEVRLSPFAIASTEVTNAQYRRLNADHPANDDRPVVKVTWSEAKAFCEHYGYRLPTEAEWEYAARAAPRAGSTSRWSFGDDEAQLGDYAWYAGNSGGEAHPVAQKQPNPWGLFDMHGNAWEWVADWFGEYPSDPQTDPAGPAEGTYRVLRGGAFVDEPRDLRSANRFRNDPGYRYRDIGFRCARSPAASLAPSTH